MRGEEDSRGEGKSADEFEVARAATMFEARLVAGYLESRGIRTFIPGEAVIDVYDGAATLWSKGVPIRVAGSQAQRARALLAERERLLRDGEGKV